MSYMVSRDSWAAEADRLGVRDELLAVLTGKSYSAVYRYRTGTRRPPDEWLTQVAAILATKELEARQSAGGAA